MKYRKKLLQSELPTTRHRIQAKKIMYISRSKPVLIQLEGGMLSEYE